ncbi:exonuclease [Clostridium tagluense]|uniref:SbcC/MukB-like Walker B domain-containing protein n=1 Tax=Clostridium tagluense TaxID=360422 RepID=UPI001CF252C1|nr:SbcC/MukB-like Walker B domain-containing protein [Clostridium tagluense]MCB2310514.1 exonuclease [Clostridium tagluense]MCB2315320.1 exonuclease [Clostridium tagluense]MCB2320171.1 exonuclease [Clostridium tagluense]MCB2325062.1 exonuclease [Clostridium tagluense]MCB2329914.1 exonuclease [Clostridium tagluense]
MKPVNLKIKGLNSFVEEQTIEFSKLTEKGLFGIFGPTASGKSTILDGITIALYGKVSRETKEFVNTETNVVEISYDFEIGLGKTRKLYRAERCIKRLKTGYFKTAYARLIEINKENSEENKVLAEGPKDVEENIIDIIGLKVEDFTRSVVLPQGRFNEFLKLTGKERRNMLERIFALEKYGTKLYEKIKRVRNENLITKNELEGEMKGYENVGQEALSEIAQTLARLKKEESDLRTQKSAVDKQYEHCKTLWELQEEKKQYVNKEAQLKLQEEEIKNKIEKSTKGSAAIKVKPFIDNVIEIKESLAKNNFTLEKLNNAFLVLCERLNITKTSYEGAWMDKNNKLPGLIEREVSLKQATTIEEKINYLAHEKAILLEQHKVLMTNINENNLKYKLIESNKAVAENKLKGTEVSLNEIEILPEYREKLQNTYNIELEVDLAMKNVDILKNKEQASQKSIFITEGMHSEALLLQENSRNKLVVLREKTVELTNNFPGDSNLLLDRQEDYSKLQDTLEKAVENHKIVGELKERYNIINTESEKVSLDLKNKSETIEVAKAKIKSIEAEIKDIELGGMAAVLASNLKQGDLCPVCGSEHHTHLAQASVNTNLEELKKLKQNGEINLEKLAKELQKEQIKAAEFLRDAEHINKSLTEVSEKLQGVNILELQEQKSISEKELIKFRENTESYNKQKTELDLALVVLQNEKSKVDLSEARLYEGLKKEKETLIAINVDLSIATESVKILQNKYMLLKEDLQREEYDHKQRDSIKNLSISEKIKQLKARDNEVIKLTATARKYRAELVILEKQRDEVDKILKGLTTSKTEIETSGKEKRAEIERLTIQIVELCGFKPSKELTPKIEIEKVRSEIKNITLKEANLREVLERENIEKQNVETQKTSEEKENTMLLKLLGIGEEKLKISLSENSFENTDLAIQYLISKEDLMILDAEIKHYEEVLRRILDNLQRVENLLCGKEIDPNFWEELKEKRQILQNVLEEKNKAVGVENRILEEMERKLKEFAALIIKRSEVEHMLGLLRELDTLIQGNKFVEYVAMKQLKYISLEASKRLKEITRGRYALELDADGAFVMRDDFNGGTRRETNTLSGGETFLTSLCLALALSSQIQLKGSAPLEFFFLDEGFGTLDTDLLEIVMNSLEKLHSSTLSVGIISHVEELKNRVPIKLIVTPAEQGQGGSKVKLEYT